jgi:hypothetical protein
MKKLIIFMQLLKNYILLFGTGLLFLSITLLSHFVTPISVQANSGNQNIIGWVDSVDNITGTVSGWYCNLNNSYSPSTGSINFEINGEIVDAGFPESYSRPDVVQAFPQCYSEQGTDFLGFRYSIPDKFRNNTPSTIKLIYNKKTQCSGKVCFTNGLYKANYGTVAVLDFSVLPRFDYYLDVNDNSLIKGWVYDRSVKQAPSDVAIHVYDPTWNRYLTDYYCDTSVNEGINNYFGLNNTEQSYFECDLDEYMNRKRNNDSSISNLQIRIMADDVLILEKTLDLKAPSTKYISYIDINENNYVEGWAFNKYDAKDGNSVSLEYYDLRFGRYLNYTYCNNKLREDIITNFALPEGKYGFTCDIQSFIDYMYWLNKQNGTVPIRLVIDDSVFFEKTVAY